MRRRRCRRRRGGRGRRECGADAFRLLDLLHFLADDDGVGFADLLRAKSVVVERTFMLVGVTMKAAVETAASAFESCETDFLSALVASILLRLFPIIIAFLCRSIGDGTVVQTFGHLRRSVVRADGWTDDGNRWRSRFQGIGEGNSGCCGCPSGS